jgi:hypothetical protein
VGAVVEVIEEIDADWLRGRVDGQVDAPSGIFPIAFVAPMEAASGGVIARPGSFNHQSTPLHAIKLGHLVN